MKQETEIGETANNQDPETIEAVTRNAIIRLTNDRDPDGIGDRLADERISREERY